MATSTGSRAGVSATVLAIFGAIAFVALYAFAVGTPLGRQIDRSVASWDLQGGWEAVAEGLASVINPITAPLGGAALTYAALRRLGRRRGAEVALVIGGPVISAQIAKHLLGGLDPLGSEQDRALGAGFYPSGHAAVVMSLALGAILVAPPRARTRATAAAGLAAGIIGSTIVGDRSHQLSDVMGSFVLAMGWAAAVVAMDRRPAPAPLRLDVVGAWFAAIVVAALGAGGVIEGVRALGVALPGLDPLFLAPAALLVAFALALTGAFERALGARGQR
jgi:membrane-associated phospholipid phosphatase